MSLNIEKPSIIIYGLHSYCLYGDFMIVFFKNNQLFQTIKISSYICKWQLTVGCLYQLLFIKK